MLVRTGGSLIVPLAVHRIRDHVAFEGGDAAVERFAALPVNVGAVIFEMIAEAVAERRDDFGGRNSLAALVGSGAALLHAGAPNVLRVRLCAAGRNFFS